MNWKSVARDLVPPVLVRAIRSPPAPRGGYISAADTVAAAGRAGLSVGDYVDQVWEQQGRCDQIINRLLDIGAMNDTAEFVVEIGAGTGRYIERTIKYCRPRRHQIYETAADWAAWLAKIYPVEVCETDGQTLKATSTASVDLVHAHGVFVYTPFLVFCRYLQEIDRVTKPGAYVVFDVFSETTMSPDLVARWLASEHRYPCILPAGYICGALGGFDLVDRFTAVFGPGLSEYLVFRKHQAPNAPIAKAS